jgi:glycosyltransferase involved in cell wall biosynthesis
MPSVSFIIPTRNQAGFIRRCIDSCLAQSLADAEVIVVDGLSTDGTQAVLADYGERIRWLSEADAGQSDAVNKGVRMARGEIIAWINSDDYYADASVLHRVLARFEQEPDLDVVYGDGLMVDARGDGFRVHRGRELRSFKEMLIRPASFVMQPAVFFRKHLFEEVGGVSLGLRWTMDYELWLRMFPRARRIRYVPDHFACATYHADAKSIQGMWDQIREVCALKRRYGEAYALGILDQARMRLGMASLYVYWLAVKLGLRRAA